MHGGDWSESRNRQKRQDPLDVAATQADIEKYQTKIASIEEKCRLILEYIEKTELKLESATKHNAKIDNYNLTLEKTQTVVEALKSKLQAYSDGIQESQKVIQDYENRWQP